MNIARLNYFNPINGVSLNNKLSKKGHPAFLHFSAVVEKIKPGISDKTKEIAFKLYQDYRRPFSLDEARVTKAEQMPESVLSKIEAFVDEKEPIRFVISCFPFKSASSEWALGKYPDNAEKQALLHLANMCASIQEVYTPGAELHVFADGRVFAPIYPGVTDQDATDYLEEMKVLTHQLGLSDSIKFHTVDDFSNSSDPTAIRTEVFDHHLMTLDEVKESIATDSLAKATYSGMKGFLEKQMFSLPEYDGKSNRAIRREAGSIAKEALRRSEAFSAWITETDPAAIRLSSHPKPMDYNAIGVWLSPSLDNWMNPWMGSDVKLNDAKNGHMLIKRKQAEALNLPLVYDSQGRPAGYEIPVDMPSAQREQVITQLKEKPKK